MTIASSGRTNKDCLYLAGMIAEMNTAQMALLFGLLCGEYATHPDALFWDVLQKLSEKRVSSTAVLFGGPHA